MEAYVEFDPAKRTDDKRFAIHELLEGVFGRPIDLVTDRALTETQARLILPPVQYAALDD